MFGLLPAEPGEIGVAGEGEDAVVVVVQALHPTTTRLSLENRVAAYFVAIFQADHRGPFP